jgi:hypothetical protein
MLFSLQAAAIYANICPRKLSYILIYNAKSKVFSYFLLLLAQESVAARPLLLNAKFSLDKKPVCKLVFSIQFGSISYLRAACNKT